MTEPASQQFETKMLPAEPTAIAPDLSHVRVLLRTSGASMAHFELGPGLVSRAVEHRTVDEIWYVLSGRAQMWRQLGNQEETVDLSPNMCITIPVGTRFQFRSFGHEAFSAVGATIPGWPDSDDEAMPVEGRWKPAT